MRIIKLGDMTFSFLCQNCKTEFEIETKELKKLDTNGFYYIDCPLCDKKIIMKDAYGIIPYAKRREELLKDVE